MSITDNYDLAKQILIDSRLQWDFAMLLRRARQIMDCLDIVDLQSPFFVNHADIPSVICWQS